MFSYEKNIDIMLYVAFSDAQFVLFSHNLKRPVVIRLLLELYKMQISNLISIFFKGKNKKSSERNVIFNLFDVALNVTKYMYSIYLIYSIYILGSSWLCLSLLTL